MTGKCANCGCESTQMKRGWTNALYCGEACEKQAVSHLHGTMPGGPNPYPGWLPHHIAREIAGRWKDDTLWSADEEPLCEDCWEEAEETERRERERDRLEAAADDVRKERQEEPRESER